MTTGGMEIGKGPVHTIVNITGEKILQNTGSVVLRYVVSAIAPIDGAYHKFILVGGDVEHVVNIKDNEKFYMFGLGDDGKLGWSEF